MTILACLELKCLSCLHPVEVNDQLLLPFLDVRKKGKIRILTC